MGLDMYLYKKVYITSGDWVREEFREGITITRGGNSHPTIKSNRIKYVIEEVGYWRKANHIHKWFVDNVQNGVDDCGYYRVTKSELKDLFEICQEVMEDNSKGPKLLSSESGFFFGSTEYDPYYYGSIIETIDILEECLGDKDAESFEYHSSW